MKKTILAISIFTLINTVQAGFVIKIPLEQSKGGALPNGSINLKDMIITPELPIEKWELAEPISTEEFEYVRCTWMPDVSKVLVGETFIQSGLGCHQNKILNIQQREKNNITMEFRNVGTPTRDIIETNIGLDAIEQEAVGISTCVYNMNNNPNDLYTGPSNVWLVYLNQPDLYSLEVTGNLIYSGPGKISASFNYNGQTYKRGSFRGTLYNGSQPIADYFEVCKY